MHIILKIIGCITACILAVSCSEISFGNDFLGKQPESSGATTEEMFSSKKNSEMILTRAYMGLPYGLPTGSDYKLGGNILESITDLCYSFRDNISDGPVKLYYNGALSATNVPRNAAYRFGSKSDWTTIRYAWLYIENIDKVPDISTDEKNERVAEAKMLIALSYFEMFRYVGGVTWLDHYVDVNEPMDFPRLTFAETVNNIVALLDEAIPHLKLKHDELNDGRMSKAGAMALKFKLLHWAASPTFNSDQKWHPESDEYTCYGDYKAERWKSAETAGREFFEAIEKSQSYQLIQPTEPTHKARREAYRKAYYDRGGTDILISTRKGTSESVHSDYITQRYYTGPTLNYVDMFPWEDGSEFPEDFNWKSPSHQPFFVYSESEGMIPTRDPRLYENVACPGDVYHNGTSAPVYFNHPAYKNGSGFLIMKHVLQENSNRSNRFVQWSHTRLPEIMLGYAEVINEVYGRPNELAYKMVNDVRARVGLSELRPNMNHDQFLEAVLKERSLELGFEEVRWFDLVRRDRQNDFTKKLYGLRTKGNDLNNPTAFTFEKIELPDHYWSSNWDTKWYLSPIPQEEINKQYGMTQNPGW
ncbi:MAG: RagB/SusD family nutrient uptake outer membrane protein [Dysgonamonadaceae bacterium]|nr:RagB/SusD family nutrient uptake outer membrane protein [Dysgonamonadaceae bacterium]MDD4399554.1 RagB/SusD family nutrient uptake outer membrane protein [Dysgonamonadaceae bacterium]